VDLGIAVDYMYSYSAAVVLRNTLRLSGRSSVVQTCNSGPAGSDPSYYSDNYFSLWVRLSVFEFDPFIHVFRLHALSIIPNQYKIRASKTLRSVTSNSAERRRKIRFCE